MEKNVRYYIIGAGLVLVLVVCSVVLGMAFRQDRLIKQQVYEEASALFDGIVLMRHWNAGYGGVYVVKRPGDNSNPFLKNPDIRDVSGKVYTLKNPATMTREISAFAEKGNKFGFHITSLKLKNPHNAPDPWERLALLSFEKGGREVSEVIDDTQGRRFFRLMRPLFIEDACMKCHLDQGYKVGDVRGGISVTLPYDNAYRALRANFVGMAGLAAGLALVLAAVLYFFVWRLMERLARQNRELAELNETKDRFLGIAAHDLRNPLVVVGGYTELLQGLIKDKGHLDMLDGISRSTAKMLGLINNLLDVSKIKSGRLELRPEEVDVAGFLNECRSLNEIIGKKKNITLKLTLPADEVRASFDRERMRQAVDNLIGNAFKYSNPGGTVTLGAESSGGAVRIWVEDQGMGMREDELPHIFDEFKTASARPTAGEAGHGLGLAIVKRVVELHGGTIDVRSRPGQGSRFTITLPNK